MKLKCSVFPNATCELSKIVCSVDKLSLTVDLPRRLMIGLLDSQALTGDDKKPIQLSTFNINYLYAHADGESIPTRPLTPDYTNGHFVRAFETLSTGVGIKNEDKSVDIRRIDYPRSYTIYVHHLCFGELHCLRTSAKWNCTS